MYGCQMRAGTIFVVIAFAVFLALPETAGVPVSDCTSKDVSSLKTEKQSSKQSARLVTEDEDIEKTQSRASNGLVSGSTSISQSRSLSEAELEQSRSSTEKKTATGSEKVEESAKKKTLVQANQKKSLVIYYLVSYKKLPSKKEKETRTAYYKRIFPKESNIKVFYHKVFKIYEKEEPKDYIERIEYMFKHVYPKLDCRLDIKYLDFWDHYYTVKYCRKVDETDDHYYARILKRLDGERFKQYKKRMACLVAALDEEDFNHITFVNNEVGYKVGKRKTPAKSYSSPKSSGVKKGKFKSSSKKTKTEAARTDKASSSTEIKDKSGRSLEEQRHVKSTKETIETDEEIACYSYKVAYTKLPKKTVGQKDEDYYKAFFGVYNPKMTTDERNELYLRILIQYKGENVTEYVQRIDFLFDKVYPQLDIRTNRDIVTMLEHYYREKYAKKSSETEDQFFDRVLKIEKGETFKHFKNRVDCMSAVIPGINWTRIIFDEKSIKGYTLKATNAKTQVKAKTCSCKG